MNMVDDEDGWFVSGRDPWGGTGRDSTADGMNEEVSNANSMNEEVSMFDKGKVATGKTIEITEDVSMFDVGKEPEKPSRSFADFALVVESPADTVPHAGVAPVQPALLQQLSL